MYTKIVNLTPHEINFMDGENNVILTVPSSGVARASQSRLHVGYIEADENIPINHCSYGEVVGLPDPEYGKVYVVSALTAQAVAQGPRRYDVFIVDEAVRDENGRIIGCRALARI